ncbi:uncharacterized protein A4U43_C04F23320 [Asparagus officinalis]|uniref:Uncharacterized protein n=1 Tax=Asparagus officinalis TaxID=4686 RepID=A0A5P1F352_ASPOF|nr:uncharacterized protein A4U43_C04F23320 [Asparagus officinalis]
MSAARESGSGSWEGKRDRRLRSSQWEAGWRFHNAAGFGGGESVVGSRRQRGEVALAGCGCEERDNCLKEEVRQLSRSPTGSGDLVAAGSQHSAYSAAGMGLGQGRTGTRRLRGLRRAVGAPGTRCRR